MTHPDQLLERDAELQMLAQRRRAALRGRVGSIVLVSGEAGIGKTALMRALCAAPPTGRALWGGCDALETPRPLGPLIDLAEYAGGRLAAVAHGDTTPSALIAALADELRGRPAVLVLEDLHWADEATLDAVRLLARRVERLPALVVATFRDDALARTDPLRVLAGELAGRPAFARVRLQPLTAEAVGTLAEGSSEADVHELHRRTGGNPFFVTEVLATRSGGDAVPETVRDAVLARAARLDPSARRLLDAVAVVPPRAELWLLERMAPELLDRLESCLGSGMLRTHGNAIEFRHEIARVAIEDALPPDERVGLHRHALSSLAEPRGRAPDFARLAHHAEAAGNSADVLRYAQLAGERAAELRAHREAAAQFARALRHADALPAPQHALLFERRSYECYVTGQIRAAADARHAALALWQQQENRPAEGDTYRWLSRLAWYEGDTETAEAEARRAVDLLEEEPPSHQLAMAYSNRAQLRMLADDVIGALDWGGRALDLAERLGDTVAIVHALTNVGTAGSLGGLPDSREILERSLELSLASGLEEHAARAYTNLGATLIASHDYGLGDRYLADGVAYCEEHDLDAWRLYMIGWQSRSALERGHWDLAADLATSVERHPRSAAPTRMTPLVVLGTLRARRGDPDPSTPLYDALELARRTGELQRLAPVAIALAELHWLSGDGQAVADATEEALALARLRRSPWVLGEMCAWRRRAGIDEPADPAEVAEPFAHELRGDWRGAAERWRALGCPYDAALAKALCPDDTAAQAGLGALQTLGARQVAARVARTLRERGIRSVPSGPRAGTKSNPAGLTPRELEVVVLLSEGLRNAEIAARLFVSEKTVDHHVSAVLRKLGVSSRTKVAAEAARLGIHGA
jgi:DNA-binding CsgD family transcriptional regulator/tetratricopeptide (TPR) repeat protein